MLKRSFVFPTCLRSNAQSQLHKCFCRFYFSQAQVSTPPPHKLFIIKLNFMQNHNQRLLLIFKIFQGEEGSPVPTTQVKRSSDVWIYNKFVIFSSSILLQSWNLEATTNFLKWKNFQLLNHWHRWLLCFYFNATFKSKIVLINQES